jgi:hydrogenase-1 operon protein HyaE
MNHPLIERLLDEFGYPEIDLDNHDEFVAQPGMNVVFLPGDPSTVKDATDVAVILPELVSAFEGALRPGVVTDTFGAGNKLKMQYGFREYPSLVFVRAGEYVGTISRVQDWVEYLDKINALLVAAPRRAPGFSIPVVGADT